MKNIKTDPIKTVLTICVGFLIVYLFTKFNWALYIALTVGLMGVFSTFLAQKIDYIWMKIGGLLSLIVPNILLSAIFYLFLFPIAFLSKVFGKKDPLMLKKPASSTFRNTESTFDKASFEKPW